MPRNRIEIPANLADLVGGTPMVQFKRLGGELGAEVIGKLEAHNPAGSVKDRIGVAMIEAAEAEGRIEPGRTTVIESTSGNTGIALAFVCAAKGYRLVITMPQGSPLRPMNHFARVEVFESGANSYYNGFTLSFRRRFSNHYLVNLSYTFAKA